MKIRDLFPNRPIDSRGVSKKNSANNSDGINASQKSTASDRSQISEEAKQLQQAARLIEESVEQLKAMPEVRVEAVQRARERVESGYYDDPEVLAGIANIISEHLSAESPVSASDLATDVIANISPDHSEMTRVDLEDIKGYIEQNLYQDEQVIEEVASRILRFLHSLPDTK